MNDMWMMLAVIAILACALFIFGVIRDANRRVAREKRGES